MRRKYISFTILTAALAVLIYVVPAIPDLLLCAVSGVLCLTVMTACVFAGGLTDAEK